jgi:hypothetical protein
MKLLKLYRVKLKGMCDTINTAYGNPYVVADNPTQALEKVQEYLNKRDLGFSSDREMDTIELLAEEGDYPECKIQIFL